MNDKPQSGAKPDANRDRQWEAFMEYRKRVRTYAWLLTVGVPAAFLTWRNDVGLWMASYCAIVAQTALVLLIIQSINLLIAYRAPEFPTPGKRKRRSKTLQVIVVGGVWLITLVESVAFWYFLSGSSSVMFLSLAFVLWVISLIALYALVTRWPERKLTAVLERKDDHWVGSVKELCGTNVRGQTLDEAREKLIEAVRPVIEAKREKARREAEWKELVREEVKYS